MAKRLHVCKVENSTTSLKLEHSRRLGKGLVVDLDEIVGKSEAGKDIRLSEEVRDLRYFEELAPADLGAGLQVSEEVTADEKVAVSKKATPQKKGGSK